MKPVLLGTAQWGLDYGITNSRGQLSDSELAKLTTAAIRWGIDLLDTSANYGTAESRILGLPESFRVQTKYSVSQAGIEGAQASLRSSREAAGRSPIRMLIHDWHELDTQTRLSAAAFLESLRNSGELDAVGISAYGAADVSAALEAFESLDLVQVPVSLLDQRLSSSSVVSEARSRGTRIQARSIFLQGVLISADSPFSNHPDVVRLHEYAENARVTPLALALSFINQLDWLDEVTFGVTTPGELDEIMSNMEIDRPDLDFRDLQSHDVALLDPRTW